MGFFSFFLFYSFCVDNDELLSYISTQNEGSPIDIMFRFLFLGKQNSFFSLYEEKGLKFLLGFLCTQRELGGLNWY